MYLRHCILTRTIGVLFHLGHIVGDTNICSDLLQSNKGDL